MTMPMHTNPRRGFTLVELLVTISIIAIVVGISFPFLRGMARTSNVQMAANSILTAVSGARAYATRPTPPGFLQPISSGGGPVRTAHDDGNGYSGAAVIVTPSNELRIVENDPAAKDTGEQPLELHTDGNLNGYRHVGKRDPNTGELIGGIDDIRLPSDVALLGIIRDTSGDVVLLPAPFAISFNQRGTIMVSNGDWSDSSQKPRFVIYDSDADGEYDINSGRNASNKLTEFRRGAARVNDEGRPMLPWDRLEPVSGVVVIDPREVSNPPYDPDRTTQYDGDESARILERAAATGRILFFNRYTGQNMAQ